MRLVWCEVAGLWSSLVGANNSSFHSQSRTFVVLVAVGFNLSLFGLDTMWKISARRQMFYFGKSVHRIELGHREAKVHYYP